MTQEALNENRQIMKEIEEQISYGELHTELDDVCYNLSIAALDMSSELLGNVKSQLYYLRILRDIFGRMKD